MLMLMPRGIQYLWQILEILTSSEDAPSKNTGDFDPCQQPVSRLLQLMWKQQQLESTVIHQIYSPEATRDSQLLSATHPSSPCSTTTF
jgi:hypothetical protein